HGGGVDVGDDAAILALEALPDVIEHVLQQRLVHSPRPPPGDGGSATPTALRTSTNAISCLSAVMRWRTLHTRYLPECSAPAASSFATVPARRMPPSWLASVVPWQRTNQPASRK